MCMACSPVSRRALLSAGVAGAASALGGVLTPGLAAGAERAGHGGAGSRDVSLRWFGTNGWEIRFGGTTMLIDPWFGRFPTGFFTGNFDPQTPLQVNEGVINAHIPDRVDQILVGHGHWDHLADIPFIARKTGAMVIGSETHRNLLLASGVPTEQIVIVEGGEVMQFDGYTIEVFEGLHSMGATKQFSVPGHLLTVPPTPKVVGDLPEGDSLIYQITIGERLRIFSMSTANYKERALRGIDPPDIALLAAIFHDQIHDYTHRLMRLLGMPRIVLPTHWDNFELPFSRGPQDLTDVLGPSGSLDAFVRELKAASPKSHVVVLDFFEQFTP